MSTMNLWHLTTTVLLWTSFVQSADPNQYSRGVDWLSRYGYLPPPDPKLGRLQSKEGIEQAIREMQRFGGIEQTGKLDEKTLALMSKPRCSLPDIMGSEDVMKRRRRKRYALSEQKWGKEKITWSLSNKPTRSRNLNDPGTLKTIMGYALKPWRDVTPLEFQEVEAHRGAEADLEISFDRAHHDDGYPFDGRGGTLAHAFFPGESRISGNTHFDDDEEWGFQDTSGQSTDLFTVAVHEFGHALGLGHSAVSGSIMAPYYAGPATRDIRSYRLPQDDTQGIQQLYGPRDPKSPNLPNPGLPDLPKPPPPHGTPVPDPTVKDRCGGSFDAVANIRGEVFFFKGKFFWRREHSGSLLSLAPAEIKNFWIGLPDNNQKIDAVYERSDSKIIFFSGSNYWVFENTKALPGYPRHINDWGMKHSDGRPVTSVEAAFVWAHNGRTFLFSGGEFWGFSNGKDIQLQGPDEGYPKGASLWKGMPSHPDDIISYREGNTYFFKGNSFWKIEKGRLDQEEVKEESTAIEWMKCEKGAVPTRPPGKEDCVCNITGSSADEWSRATFQSVVLIAVMIFVQLL